MDKLTKTQWNVPFIVMGILLALGNYDVNIWTFLVGLACGYTSGCFTYWISNIVENWIDDFINEN